MRIATALLALLLFAPLLRAADSPAKIAGVAFVGSDVTGQGGKAKLPPGTRIYPPGSTIAGTEGCPTTPYGTDGMMVAVIDYQGRKNAASLTIVRAGQQFGGRPPYYLDLDAGRRLQFLGPLNENGSYTLKLEIGMGRTASEQTRDEATFTLARDCKPPR